MLREALELIQDTARAASEARVFQLPNDARKAFVRHGNTLTEYPVPPPIRDHKLYSLDALIAWAGDHANDDMDWIQTYTGRAIDPVNMGAADVDIADIAHALALQCRFNGHTRAFYSVAQHAVHVCDRLPEPLRLAGLLHDAAEAYLGDTIQPIKDRVRPLVALEALVWEAVAARFRLPPRLPDEIRHVDRRMLATEARDLMPPVWRASLAGVEPYERPIVPWDAQLAEAAFLNRFANLGGAGTAPIETEVWYLT